VASRLQTSAPPFRTEIYSDRAAGAYIRARTSLNGAMTIRIEGGKHFYDLAYEIAPR
jgi:hypothetical protein